MKAFGVSFLLLLLMTAVGYAGGANYVKKDGTLYKHLKISVSVKSSKNLLFTVEIGKVGKLMDFYLSKGEKNIKLKPKVKNGKVEVQFEIESEELKDSLLNFSYPNGSRCPPTYFLKPKEYIALKSA